MAERLVGRYFAVNPAAGCLLAVWAAVSAAGCVSQTPNPSFPTRVESAQKDLGRMESQPRELRRPLLVVGGILDPGIASGWLKWEFESLTGDRRVIAVSLGDCLTLSDCRAKIVAAVERAYPSKSREQTAEVDVIGYSLGGLASRYAANPAQPGRRLRIARLFAISSPLRGAAAAENLPLLHPMQADLRPGSHVLASLDATDLKYPVYSYVCLNDVVIGEANAALPGQTAWWLPDVPLIAAHGSAFYDPRILADIARRLRDEPSLAQSPPAALPAGG